MEMTETISSEPATLGNYTPPKLENLRLEILPGKIVVLYNDRPERMNSQTVKMFEEYNTVAYALRDTDARALIIRGAGERAFCAGFDLDEIDVITTMGVRDFLKFQETATGGLA